MKYISEAFGYCLHRSFNAYYCTFFKSVSYYYILVCCSLINYLPKLLEALWRLEISTRLIIDYNIVWCLVFQSKIRRLISISKVLYSIVKSNHYRNSVTMNIHSLLNYKKQYTVTAVLATLFFLLILCKYREWYL